MNDTERRQWVENDEELYTRWRSSGVGLYQYVRENREGIDKVIEIVTGRKPKRLPACMPWGPAYWGQS